MRSPGLIAIRQSCWLISGSRHSVDRTTSAECWEHLLEEIFPTVEHTDTCVSEDLVPRREEEINTRRYHIEREMRKCLRCIDDEKWFLFSVIASEAWRSRVSGGTWIASFVAMTSNNITNSRKISDSTSDIGCCRQCHEFRACDFPLEITGVDTPILRHSDPVDLYTIFLCDDLPGNNISMVIEKRKENTVSFHEKS